MKNTKTRIEMQVIDGQRWYSPQAKINNEPYKYIHQNPIGVFSLSEHPIGTRYNFIEGAEKEIDYYLLVNKKCTYKTKKSHYIKYPK